MSPPIKKKREEEEVKRDPDGIIRFEVEKISKMDDVFDGDDGRYSPNVEVRGVLWNANVWRDVDLNITLAPLVKQLSPWEIAVEAQFSLVHSDNSKNISIDRSITVGSDRNSFTVVMLRWVAFSDNLNGVIVDDNITIEIRLWISKMKGVKHFPRFDFSDPNNPRNNVTFVIDGEKIYSNKEILASHSLFFNSMFFGEFAEKNQDEIELKDVDREEFLEMLHVIYPSRKNITIYSAEYLLKLGDRFQITDLVDRAEVVLIECGTYAVTNIDKLIIADKYNLFGLLEHCLSNLKTTKDYKDLKESPLFQEISDATKVILFERLITELPANLPLSDYF